MAAAAALVGASAGCSGAPLGGGKGTGGTGDEGGGGCTPSGSCITATGGSIGTGGTGGALCDQIDSAYASALTAASTCTPGAPNQCQTLVATLPTECPNLACGQQAYVNDGSDLEALDGKWLQACTPEPPHSCPYIACDPPLGPATCVPSGPGATTGTCVPSVSDAGATNAPDGGESCDQLAADYAAAVSVGRVCTPGAPGQCQVAVNTTPSSCFPSQCDVNGWVSDATAVDAAQARWLAQCGGQTGCVLILGDPISVSCVPAAPGDAGTATGLCTAVLTAPPI
jgi:hypothetical protein